MSVYRVLINVKVYEAVEKIKKAEDEDRVCTSTLSIF